MSDTNDHGQTFGEWLAAQKGGKPWSEEDLDALRQMARDGRLQSEIARSLGRTMASTSTRISLMRRRGQLDRRE